jgi:NADH-quinone oxidoreductase subunit L
MAGPTPVSALIHAATMVTAGIFLVVRSNFLFEAPGAEATQEIMMYIGLATSLIAAFIAMRQNDIKKVLAYSTVSQLGFIFVALGMGAYTAAIFHVTTHAFFKALLFLGSGSVIHAMSDEQDIRKMGGLKKFIPITHLTFLIGTLAIAGFPFLSGFFSKDEILAHALHGNVGIYVALAFSALLTAVYMFRLYFVVFHGSFRGGETLKHHLHESPLNMTLPLMVLAVLSVIGGLLNIPSLFGEGMAHWMSHYLEHITLGLNKVEAVHLSNGQTIMLMVAASVITLIALLLTYVFYTKKESLPVEDDQLKGIAKLSANKLYFDEIYNALFVVPVEKLSTFSEKYLEVYLNKFIYFFAFSIGKSGDLVKKWQSGFVASYILWMVLGIVGLVLFYIIKR